jgi:RNA polymerase sigma-70 factor (ECF subfamily)
MTAKKGAPISTQLTHVIGNETKNASDMLSDKELVIRAQQDDTWAFEQLVRRYQHKAYAIAAQMGNGDVEEATDITQQAFLNAFRSIKKFKGGASFYTWFYRILVNTCLDARRRHHRWRQLFSFRSSNDLDENDKNGASFEDFPDPNHRSEPDATFESKELDHSLQAALRSLPEKQRCAFQLKIFQGLTIAEISEIMGIRPGTIKSHLFRATKSLRNGLAAWERPKRRKS